MAHDYNNQLAVILGYGELLAGQVGDREDLREPIEAIREAARYASELTKELLSVGRRQALVRQRVDVNELVHFARCRSSRSAWSRGRQWKSSLRRIPRSSSAIAWSSSARCYNSRPTRSEAMPLGGTLTLRVSSGASGDTPAGRSIALQMVDDGRGMSPEVLAHATEPFFTTKPFGEGNGLGLASVEGIVYQSGGSMTIESAPGKGTTVHIQFPAARPNDTEVRPVSAG